MRDQLIGYVLGALDGPEQEEVERRLNTDPQLKQELELVRRAVSPLECDKVHHDPPHGLAATTCRRVAALCVVPAARQDVGAGGSRAFSRTLFGWNLIDVAVAAGIFIAAGMLLMPALNHSRFNAQLVNCQNNLGQIGRGLGRFSLKHDGEFPAIPVSGKLSAAGVYAPELIDSHEVNDDPRMFHCPAGDAGRCVSGDSEHCASADKIPTMSELAGANGDKLKEMLARAGGSYGYTLGYEDGGQYHPTRSRGRVNFPIMADTPCPKLGYQQSSNHGGLGQNVLFEDGHYRFLTTSHQPEGCPDPDFFRNNDGKVAAGKTPDDAVIGCSTARPREQ